MSDLRSSGARTPTTLYGFGHFFFAPLLVALLADAGAAVAAGALPCPVCGTLRYILRFLSLPIRTASIASETSGCQMW
jgi:hypothetical protein